MKTIKYPVGLIALLMVMSSQINASNPSSAISSAPKYLTSPETEKSKLPFSEAVQVGNMLYLSGQIGIDPATGKLAPGGIAAETRQTMENIKATLEKYGSSMDKVVKCTVFIDDIEKWGELNKVYVSYFKKHFPARSALGADGLALGSAVEIECFATIN
jgi:reactive intermediate/imine deaminase